MYSDCTIGYIYYRHTEKLQQKVCKIQNYHSKLKTELSTVAVHKCLNKKKFFPTSMVMSGKFEMASGKNREMSGNFVLSILYEPWGNDGFLHN